MKKLFYDYRILAAALLAIIAFLTSSKSVSQGQPASSLPSTKVIGSFSNQAPRPSVQ
jgi:hypothetical protein